MSLKQLTALFALGALWGASYIFIRVAVTPIGPVMLMFLRAALTAAILLGYASLRRLPLDIRAHWRKFLVLGFFGSALPFTLIAWAELTVTGSMAAILMSTTPLFTAFVAAVGLGERLTPHKLIGALLGIVGVSITVGGSPLALKPEVIAATLALVLLCTAFAYQLYYYLIISAGPLQALTVTLLIPVFGVIWGALLLDEIISPGMIAGLLIVLLSVGLVTGMIAPGKGAHTK